MGEARSKTCSISKDPHVPGSMSVLALPTRSVGGARREGVSILVWPLAISVRVMEKRNSEHPVVGAWCPIQCTWSYAIPGPLPPFTSHCHLHCWGTETQKHSTVPEPGPRLLGSK